MSLPLAFTTDLSAFAMTMLAVAVVSALSLLGSAYLLSGILRRHTVLMGMVAIAVGALLGDAFMHILPEATEVWGGFTPKLGLLVLAGFLPFFILESLLRWRHTHAFTEEHGPSEHTHVGHLEPHAHDHAHDRPRAPRGPAAFGILNLAGSAMHNLLDGAVIAAAFLADVNLGIATAIAVGLHEIPHELGDVAVLMRSGFTARRAIFFNFLSACTALLGALAVLVLPVPTGVMERYALPITAGGFLYIAAADLIPELHHHTGDRRQTGIIVGGLVVGLGLMYGLLRLE